MRRRFAICLGVAVLASYALAQSRDDVFTTRLTWMPISAAQQNLVGGKGSARATLSRGRITIAGAFDGLPAPATVARLHHGTATGARGPAIAEFEISPAINGMISGEFDLDRAQHSALVAGHLYIQLHAERGVPPDDAVLRGWLLADR